MTVPEASVHEDDGAVPGEDQVGSSGEPVASEAVSQAECM